MIAHQRPVDQAERIARVPRDEALTLRLGLISEVRVGGGEG